MIQEPEEIDPWLIRRVEDLLNQAETQFQRNDTDLYQVEDILRQVLRLLEDHDGRPTLDARCRAGEIWQILVENTRDLDRSEKLLQEGTKLFSDSPVSESLDSMLVRNRHFFSLKDALVVTPGRAWPDWFEKPNANKWMQSLLHNIDELLKEPYWPALQEQTTHYKDLLLEEYLPAYISPLPDEAHQQASQGNFARALQTTQKALQFFKEEIIPYIPKSVDRHDLHKLKDAIEARQQGEVDLWKAIVNIVGQSSSISEVLSGIELELPDHPDVAMDDLRATLSDLEKAAQIESAPDELSDQDFYQMDFQDLKQRNQTHFNTLEKPADFLIRSDPRTVKKLQSILHQLRERSTHDPVKVIRQLTSELEQHVEKHLQDAATLLKPYWQLVWFLETELPNSQDLKKTAQQAINAARGKPEEMLLRAAKVFENTQNEQSLNQFLRLLATIQLLNHGLSRYPQPSDSDQDKIVLPPLPDGVVLPEIEAQLDSVAIGRWEEIAYSWLRRSLDHIPSESHTTSRGDYMGLEHWEHSIEEFLHEVYELRHDVWVELNLPHWDQNSLPGKIMSDCELLLQLVGALRAIEGELDSRAAVESALSWKQCLLKPGLIDDLEDPVIWLLKPQRSGLRQHVRLLKDEIESRLENEIRKILESQPPSVKQLNQVLAPNLPKEFALTARQSVEKQATSLAREARLRVDYEIALAVWDTVRRATHPRADLRVESSRRNGDADDLWRDLHNKATWEYRKALLFTRRRQFIVGVVGLVIVFVASGIFSRALLGGVQGRGRPAISIADTSTTTAAVSQTPVPTSTQDLQALTVTAVFFADLTASKEVADALASTGTAQAQITATAFQAEVLDQTVTAQSLQATEISQNATATAAADPAFQATTAALVCLTDPSAYSLEVIKEADLNPDLESLYIRGDPIFSVTASWTVRNTGECDWKNLVVEPYQDARQLKYSFWGESEQIEITSENPLEVGQSLKIILSFPILEARDINEAWALVANGVQIQNSPHLALEVDDWIIVVYPTPTPTPKTGGKPPTDEPKPTVKPTEEPPPTARPSEPPPTARP